MEKQDFKVLDYFDDKGKEQTLSFECHTPHILIQGDELNQILELEKRMLKNLSSSNGEEIDLVVIDDASVLQDDFFSDLEFNTISRMTEVEAIKCLKGGPIYLFEERYTMLARNEARNFTKLNEGGKEHLKMIVFFFPSVSENQKLHKALGRSGTSIVVGVHFIIGINFNLEKPQLFDGCETRFSFPSKNKFRDMKLFCKDEEELPKTGHLWLKPSCSGDVEVITLK